MLQQRTLSHRKSIYTNETCNTWENICIHIYIFVRNTFISYLQCRSAPPRSSAETSSPVAALTCKQKETQTTWENRHSTAFRFLCYLSANMYTQLMYTQLNLLFHAAVNTINPPTGLLGLESSSYLIELNRYDQPAEVLPGRWFPASARWCSHQPWQAHTLLRQCRSP